METASGLLSSACQLAWGPVCQQLNYIRKLRENEKTMQSEWRTLSSRKDDICKNLDTGYVRYGKKPKAEVTDWLKKVEKIEEKVDSLGSGSANHMCCKGFCPNYYSHLKKSKKIVGILCEVKDLQEKGKTFAEGENLFIDSLPQDAGLPATTLHGTSAERKKEQILQCIMDPEVGKIGVYGMGGVGKTTIMRRIYNQLKEKKDDFGIVMWVTVSSVFELAKLQETIAEQLGCELSSDETSRAMELSQALRRRRNFVIIFDDIWDGVSLQTVGIPEDGNGSKIVWTTRSRAVCHSMESNREIEVEGLTPEEAWSLFNEKVGGEDIISPEIKPIAEQIARECRGLPLALITIGRALRKENQLPVWRNALQELKTSSIDQTKDMAKYVFGSLKFSYDRLSSDTIRACFLYCALYPEDYDILVDELIEHWMAEGLIDEEGSIQTEKDKAHAYLKELKDACMIQSNWNDNEYVRMHDLIRDLAINITKEQFMVKAGLRLKKSPKKEEWVESLERVSLMGNLIEAFQDQPNCPQLSTLLLHYNYWERVTFSDTFFKHMHNLKVLNLSLTGIKSLPDSLSDLVNLHALILTGCRMLECLPSLAKLRELRQLKLGQLSSLNEFPHGLENLVKLRHLDISEGRWGSFPSGVLLKMSCLEILFMQGGRWRLSCESNANAEDNSIIGEITTTLQKLAKFSADFADVPPFIGMEKVTVPATTNTMAIKGCNFIQLLDIFHWDDLRQLIYCRIDDCKEMKWLGKDGDIVFPSLETLRLLRLHSFKGLCREKTHKETLKNLRKLDIFECHKLKYLIPNDLLMNNLQNLEEILIRRCHEMEDVISGKASATMASLPKFKKLMLWELPELTSIYQGKLVCDSLCQIRIQGCPKLKSLPFLMNNVQLADMSIIVSEEW
ncbi:disease resistance protein RPS2 protein [Dioscorea alata]|uniref:Disease resistance protein RPS2 protein n=1 Tax=Dioscorea alata TaxID=55571 RepID=A0ACB7WPN1_DIOAL|nr:disease resistance protein RPS2 protein [Dioscorea alata]